MVDTEIDARIGLRWLQARRGHGQKQRNGGEGHKVTNQTQTLFLWDRSEGTGCANLELQVKSIRKDRRSRAGSVSTTQARESTV
jgi:hypothetical protein